MSELAYNANGDTFEIPATVTGWRVRRMKPRGAPELVYGRDGRPLTVPVESEIDDLREAVVTPGRYRLDPINDDGKCVDGVPPAYVQVVKPERTADTSTALVVPSTGDDAIREAMRLNTELAKSVIDRFPDMMTAAAELLRAADGAGLPARRPRELDADDHGDEADVDDARNEVASAAPPSFDLNTFVNLLIPKIPDIITGLMSGTLKIPAFAEMFDWRKASASGKAHETAPTAERASAKTKPESAKRESTRATSAGPAAANEPTHATEAHASGVEPTLPPMDPATLMHFVAIQGALKPEEAALARAVAADLGAAELRAWFDDLKAMDVPGAVATIRSMIGKKKGGAS